MSNRTACYTTRRRKRHNWQTLSPEPVYACDPALILVGLAGSELIRAGERYGLVTREEVFADRGYQADGSLVPRSQPGALIENEEQALAQTLEMVQHGRVKSITGEWAMVTAQTVCYMAMASTHWRSPADYELHLLKRGLLSQHNPD